MAVNGKRLRTVMLICQSIRSISATIVAVSSFDLRTLSVRFIVNSIKIRGYLSKSIGNRLGGFLGQADCQLLPAVD